MGGGGKETDYFVTCAVAICRGPIRNLWRVFADSKLIFSQNSSTFEGPLWASGLNPAVVPLSQYTTIGDYGAELSFQQSSVDKGAAPVIPQGTGMVYFGTEDQPPDPTLQALATGTYGANELVPAYRGLAYVVFNNFPLKTFGNRVPSFTFEVNGDEAGQATPYPIRTIVESVLQEEGISSDRMDISALTDTVFGYSVTSEASGRVILEPLQEMFLFDLVESNYGIKATYRQLSAAFPSKDVQEQDLGAHVPSSGGPGLNPVPKFTRTRKQDLDLPQRLSVRYKSASGNAFVGDFGFEVGTVYAQRARGAVNTTSHITYDTNVCTTDDAMKAIAVEALHMAYANKTTYTLTLPLPFIEVDPGDTINVHWTSQEGDPQAVLVYVQQVEIGADLTIHITGVSTDNGTPAI
jgi:hypothetical protein